MTTINKLVPLSILIYLILLVKLSSISKICKNCQKMKASTKYLLSYAIKFQRRINILGPWVIVCPNLIKILQLPGWEAGPWPTETQKITRNQISWSKFQVARGDLHVKVWSQQWLVAWGKFGMIVEKLVTSTFYTRMQIFLPNISK